MAPPIGFILFTENALIESTTEEDDTTEEIITLAGVFFGILILSGIALGFIICLRRKRQQGTMNTDNEKLPPKSPQTPFEKRGPVFGEDYHPEWSIEDPNFCEQVNPYNK